jgi:adenylate cyclase
MAQQVTLKLSVVPGRHSALPRHPLLKGAAPLDPQQLVSIYYDTRRLALRKAGVIVRLRRAGASWNQTVKRQDDSRGGVTLRPEWHSPYLQHFDFSSVDDQELRAWLQDKKIGPLLMPVFETRFRRLAWQLEPRPGTRVLVKLDRGWVASSGRQEPICELELTLLAGQLDGLYDLATALAERQPLPLLLTSKAERGYRVFLNQVMQPVKARPVAIAPNDPPLAAFRQIALDCLEHLQFNHQGALVSDDPEYVHQMRVATRRLRAAMRMFRPVLPPEFAERLTGPLRELMATLGKARDLDVLMAEIVAPVVGALPDEPRVTELASVITERSYAARVATRGHLQHPAYGRLLLLAAQMLHGADFVAPQGVAEDAASLLAFAEKRLRRLLRRVVDLAAAARADYPPSLHELRIAIKRLRYALEFFGHLVPGNRAAKLVGQLAGLQERLGQLNDLASAGTLLMACAGNDGNLREAVALIGGWHGPRHADLLAEVPAFLHRIRGLKLPRFT